MKIIQNKYKKYLREGERAYHFKILDKLNRTATQHNKSTATGVR